jgi:hypothetical protein
MHPLRLPSSWRYTHPPPSLSHSHTLRHGVQKFPDGSQYISDGLSPWPLETWKAPVFPGRKNAASSIRYKWLPLMLWRQTIFALMKWSFTMLFSWGPGSHTMSYMQDK